MCRAPLIYPTTADVVSFGNSPSQSQAKPTDYTLFFATPGKSNSTDFPNPIPPAENSPPEVLCLVLYYASENWASDMYADSIQRSAGWGERRAYSYHLGSTCSGGGPFSLFRSMAGHEGVDTDDERRTQKQRDYDAWQEGVASEAPPDTTGYRSEVDGRLFATHRLRYEQTPTKGTSPNFPYSLVPASCLNTVPSSMNTCPGN